ncbi:hypothetical protein GSI_08126 [Ganoderma sinense ZZ0214-1]|uniref:Uncharacterized protein n=1 Tax=Ganoderma sinense ZZ0214-1 TaxID=1077348 RepID=A0A2G8S825_9APHY|nr:hypothetical protein GSI_08126 [Ganoderma sinense ZZ0214-1]
MLVRPRISRRTATTSSSSTPASKSLQANPELKTFVHTVIVTPAAFRPSPLYVHPNISSIECVDELQVGEPDYEDDEGKHESEPVFGLGYNAASPSTTPASHVSGNSEPTPSL